MIKVRNWLKNDAPANITDIKTAVDDHLKSEHQPSKNESTNPPAAKTVSSEPEKRVELLPSPAHLPATTGAPAPNETLAPSFAPALFQENFVGVVHVGISADEVNQVRNKVNHILKSLDQAHGMMKAVTKDGSQKLPIPIETDNISMLKEQIDVLSAKLQQLQDQVTDEKLSPSISPSISASPSAPSS
jgi:hypothetical protein